MRGQALIATLVSLLPVVLLWLASVAQLEGGLLLGVFVGYTFFLLLRADREAVMRLAAAEGDEDEDDEDNEDEDTGDTDDGEQPLQVRTYIGFHWKPVLLTFGGLVAMAVGGPATVEGALPFAAFFGAEPGGGRGNGGIAGNGSWNDRAGSERSPQKTLECAGGGIPGSFAYNLLVTLGLAAAIHSLPVEPRNALFAYLSWL